MPEVANPGEDHGQSQAVGCGNHVLVLDRASRLNDCGCACSRNCLKPVGKGEESVGGSNGTASGSTAFMRPEFGGVNAAHLPCADANGLAVARVDDGVRLDVFADSPGKKQAAQFVCRGRTQGDDVSSPSVTRPVSAS